MEVHKNEHSNKLPTVSVEELKDSRNDVAVNVTVSGAVQFVVVVEDPMVFGGVGVCLVEIVFVFSEVQLAVTWIKSLSNFSSRLQWGLSENPFGSPRPIFRFPQHC